jgi:hypothetical protein
MPWRSPTHEVMANYQVWEHDDLALREVLISVAKHKPNAEIPGVDHRGEELPSLWRGRSLVWNCYSETAAEKLGAKLERAAEELRAALDLKIEIEMQKKLVRG